MNSTSTPAPHAAEGLPRDRAGVSLKPQHYLEIAERKPSVGWFEVHAENYMGAGGPPHRWLSAVRADYPISIHGVGLSIGSAEGLDPAHLSRLAELVARYAPAAVSEHLAWSGHGGRYFADLLPVPYTDESLARVCSHVDQVQSTLGRTILLENPATYLSFAKTDRDATGWRETDFLAEISRRTGCGLLLDVNNVQVSAVNLGFDPAAHLAAFPLDKVGEIHLAGHATDADEAGRPLLIDTHDRPVSDPVWTLYAGLLQAAGPLPTLIEWDRDLPVLDGLLHEAGKADRLLRRARAELGPMPQERRHAVA